MKPFSLYCKSYRVDVKRVTRLAETVKKYNADKLPFFISVPKSDIPLFEEYLSGLNVTLLADETIIESNSRINPDRLAQLPGSISQQIVKSEFWRLGFSAAYLCLDSDSVFLRPFHAADFITADGVPYTVMDEAHDLLLDALSHGKTEVIDNFNREAQEVQQLFNRIGKSYSFGPMPMVWHRLVWESLADNYLMQRGMTFMDAILLAPLESRWYGEALLRYKAIPLMPCEPFFMVYHYAWQLDKHLRKNIGQAELAKLYSGAIYQSSWEREMDWPSEGGTWLSRAARRLRRQLGRS
jgi:hypothetical protein